MGINSKGFITIQSWMVTDLKLKGNDLLVYAIIYGLSQDAESRFHGSLQYLADWCSCTKQGVQKNLKALIEKGLIDKKEEFHNGVKYCTYSCIPCNSVVQGYATMLHGGMQLSCTNNIDNNIDDNKDKRNIKEKESYSVDFENWWREYPRKKEKSKAYACYKARIKDGVRADDLLMACNGYAAECRKRHTEEEYIKHPATFLSSKMPFYDYITKVETKEENTENENYLPY